MVKFHCFGVSATRRYYVGIAEVRISDCPRPRLTKAQAPGEDLVKGISGVAWHPTSFNDRARSVAAPAAGGGTDPPHAQLTCWLRGDVHDPDLNRFSITVGEVRTSPDLKVATAYVLPLGGKGQDDVLKLLARNKSELRRAIGKKTGLKFTPDLRFQLDQTFDQMDETRRMLNQDHVRQDIEPDE